MILTLCQRFHKLPSEILNEDVELLQLLQIWQRGKLPDEGADDG